MRWMFLPAESWDTAALESWLEAKAAGGWKIESSGPWFARFSAMAPGRYRVRLLPRGKENPQALEEKLDTYEAMGWIYAAEIGGCQVFYCGDAHAPELETDPAVQQWAWGRHLRCAVMVGLVSVLASLGIPAVLAHSVLAESAPVETLLYERGVQTALALLMWVPLLAVSIRQFRIAGRAWRQLRSGLALSHRENWRRPRRQRIAFLAILCVYALGVLVYPFYQLAVSDSVPLSYAPPDLPYVEGRALGLGDERKDGWCDIDRGLLGCRYTITETFTRQCRQETVCFLTPLPALAQGIYEEKLAAEETPESRVQNVSGDFDQAVLLTRGPVQYFLARTGRAVLAVWTNAGENLEAYEAAFAEILRRAQAGEYP